MNIDGHEWKIHCPVGCSALWSPTIESWQHSNRADVNTDYSEKLTTAGAREIEREKERDRENDGEKSLARAQRE